MLLDETWVTNPPFTPPFLPRCGERTWRWRRREKATSLCWAAQRAATNLIRRRKRRLKPLCSRSACPERLPLTVVRSCNSKLGRTLGSCSTL